MEGKKKFLIGTAIIVIVATAFSLLQKKTKTDEEILINLISLYSSKNIVALTQNITQDSSIITELANTCDLKYGVEPSQTFTEVNNLKKSLLSQFRITELSENPDALKEFATSCNKIAYTASALGKLRVKEVKIVKTSRLETGHTVFEVEAKTFADTELKITIDTVPVNNAVKLSSIYDTEELDNVEEYTEVEPVKK